MKTLFACSAALVVAFTATPALAQSNPFMPPQAGMSRDQIQSIVRQEIEKARASQPATPTRNSTGGPATSPSVASAVANTAQQPGATPSANTASNAAPATPAVDPIGELLKDGGVFVGCVGGTPVFKDKIGRRAYFTTKELRESNEARRFARCG